MYVIQKSWGLQGVGVLHRRFRNAYTFGWVFLRLRGLDFAGRRIPGHIF